MGRSETQLAVPVDNVQLWVFDGQLVQVLARQIGGIVIDNQNLETGVEGENFIEQIPDVIALIIRRRKNKRSWIIVPACHPVGSFQVLSIVGYVLTDSSPTGLSD